MDFEDMKKWKYTLKIKDLLTDSDDQSKAQSIGRAIGERVNVFLKRNIKSLEDDYTLDDICNRINNVNTVGEWEGLCPEWDDCPPITELNGVLSELYDWADRNDCWIE